MGCDQAHKKVVGFECKEGVASPDAALHELPTRQHLLLALQSECYLSAARGRDYAGSGCESQKGRLAATPQHHFTLSTLSSLGCFGLVV